MIKLVVFACVALFVNCEIGRTTVKLPPEVQASVLNALDKCCVNKEEIPDIKQLILKGECRHDQEFKTMMHCIWKETGYVTEDGRLIIDKAAAVFPDKEKMIKIFTACDKDMGEMPDENVYKGFKCFQDTSVYRIDLTQ